MFTRHLGESGFYFRIGNQSLILFRGDIFALTGHAVRYFSAPEAIIFQRLTKLCIEINLVIGFAIAVSPTAPFWRTLHPTGNGMIVDHLYGL